MFKQFPFYKQRDAMDCGPTCLMMIAEYHGKNYTLPYLREHCHLSREGVSALGITQAAETIGLRASTVKVSYDKMLKMAACSMPPSLAWRIGIRTISSRFMK